MHVHPLDLFCPWRITHDLECPSGGWQNPRGETPLKRPSENTAKRHPKELIQPEWGDDYSLRNILGSHRDLVVASNQLNLGEYTHAGEVSREILNVRYCGIIETPILSIRTPAPRGFWHHVQW